MASNFSMHSMFTADWRSQVPLESRQEMSNKLTLAIQALVQLTGDQDGSMVHLGSMV
jgi:hypothetical protein